MSPLQAANLRLLETLPRESITTHHQQSAEDARGENMRRGIHWRHKPKIRTTPAKVVNGNGRGGWNREAILVDGIAYKSFRAAREALKIGNRKLLDWIESGRARKVTHRAGA